MRKRGRRPIDGRDARIALQAARQIFDSTQKLGLQHIARRRLQPQLPHLEAVRALKLACIPGDVYIWIDIGERVGLQGKRRKFAGYAEERGRPA